MRQKHRQLAAELKRKLASFERANEPLLGISTPAAREAFIGQLLDSVNRIDFIDFLATRNRPMHADRCNPNSAIFDPHRAAIIQRQAGNVDEAFWLTFLAVHFGKNLRSKWELPRAVYGGLGTQVWTWAETTSKRRQFRTWVTANADALKETGSFGNHRKYESVKEIADVVESYIEWVGPSMSHLTNINTAIAAVGNDPRDLFDELYRTMKVKQFGRTGKFDYLTMVGKLRLVRIEPKSTYMNGATGPYDGGNLLFTGEIDGGLSRKLLSDKLGLLEAHLGLYYGMQILEDSLCNWQKSPDRFIPFRG